MPFEKDPTLEGVTEPLQAAADIFLSRYHTKQYEDFLANEHTTFLNGLQQAAQAVANMEDEEGAANGFKIYQSSLNNYLIAASNYSNNPKINQLATAQFQQATKQFEQMTAAKESVESSQAHAAGLEKTEAETEGLKAETGLAPAREELYKAQAASHRAAALKDLASTGEPAEPLTTSGLFNKIRRNIASPPTKEEEGRIKEDLASIRRDMARELIARKIAGKQQYKDVSLGVTRDWTYSDDDIARAANEISREDVRNKYIYNRMTAEAELHGVHPLAVKSQYEHLVNPYRRPEYAEPIDRAVTDRQLLTLMLGLNTVTEIESQQVNVDDIKEIEKRLPDHYSKLKPGPIQDIFEEVKSLGGSHPDFPDRGFNSIKEVRDWLTRRSIQKIEQMIGGEGIPYSDLNPGGKRMRDRAEAFARNMINQYLPIILAEIQQLSGEDIPGAKKAIEAAAKAIAAKKKKEPGALDFGPITKKVKGVLRSILDEAREELPGEEVK